MGILGKKIVDFFDITKQKVELTNELCEHLHLINVNASVFRPETPEFKESQWGLVKVEDHNIDWIEINLGLSASHPSAAGHETVDSWYYLYHTRVNVEGSEKTLKVEGKPTWKGFFSNEVVDYQWKGGGLAQRLNADTDLKTMLITTQLGLIFVQSQKKFHGTACIVPEYPKGTSRRIRLLPSRRAFDTYDRIAHHIRSIAGLSVGLS